MTFHAGGEPIELSEHEAARGRRDLKRQIAEIRAVNPAMRIIEDFRPFPLMVVGWWFENEHMEMRVDPLGIVQRAINATDAKMEETA